MKGKWDFWLWFKWLIILLALGACARHAVEQEVWRETFDARGDWRLSTDAAAAVTVEDGQLRIHVRWPGQIAWASAGRVFRDGVVRVEATPVSGPMDNEYGLLLRMDGDDRFYAFSISGDGYVRIALYDEGTWTVLGPDWTPHPAIKQGEVTNVLEVEARGMHFTFRVNGEEVAQVEDAHLAVGDVGLYAGAFDQGDVVVVFDNLELLPE